MFLDIEIILFYAVLVSAIYHLIPKTWVRGRYGLIIGSSLIVLFVYSPYVLAYLFVSVALAVALFYALRNLPRGSRMKNLSPLLLFLPLFYKGLVPPETQLMILGYPESHVQFYKLIITLGLSFYILKLYGSLREALKAGELGILPLVSTASFFPSFAAGPIDYASRFNPSVIGAEFDAKLYARGILRIGVGVLKLYLITGLIRGEVMPFVLDSAGAPAWEVLAPWQVYGYSVLYFLELYVNFSGYTDIAIGIGWMFNIKLTENFRMPFLAHSIQNFWQRWHLSLAGFINKYLFLPMVRATGRPKLSIFCAFVLVGLWHQFSWNYFIWGLGHGAALAGYMYFSGESRKQADGVRGAKARLWRLGGIVLTVSYVSILSTFANLGSFGQGLVYLHALLLNW